MNVIILDSVVLMGASHSIRNKLNVIRGTALKEKLFSPTSLFSLFFSPCERFEPRSNFIGRWNMIVRLIVVVNRTVVDSA